MSVIVTGMHRSGTSTVARLVEAFGLSIGHGPFMPAAPDNPRGFFERADVADFNDAWLARLGGAWWAPPATDPDLWRQLDEASLRSARAELDLFQPDAAPWFSKDPRTALLLPLWDRLALREHPVIVCVRAPTEVAVSLGLRNGLSPRRALGLWVAYTAAAIRHLGRRPAMVIDRHATLENPAATVDAVDAFLRQCGHTPAASWSRREADALIEPHLHRAQDLGDDADLSAALEFCHDVHRQLARRHGEALRERVPLSIPAWADEVLYDLRELYRARDARDAARAALAAERRPGAASHTTGPIDSDAPDPIPAAAPPSGEALDGLRLRVAALEQERDGLLARVAALDRALDDAATDRRELEAALREATLAADMEIERAQLAECQLAEVMKRLATSSGAAANEPPHIAILPQAARAVAGRSDAEPLHGPDLTSLPPPNSPGDVLAELERDTAAAAAALERRRAAMAEMSVELERRRARAARAESIAAALEVDVARLRPIEVERDALGAALLAVRFERDNLRAALERCLREQVEATAALDDLRVRRTWRLGRRAVPRSGA